MIPHELLNKYERNVTSQHGEDGIVEYIVDRLGDRMGRTFCEFGAWDGVVCSNTYNLWHNHSWEGLLIESSEEKYANLKENIRGFEKVQALQCLVRTQGRDSLDDIIKRLGIDPCLGVLSIDVDSYDYHIWKHLDHVRPCLVIVEHNYLLDPEAEYYDPEDESFMLCSTRALELVGKKKGYRLICCTATNSLFLRDDLYDEELFPNSDSQNVYHYNNRQRILKTLGVAIRGANVYPVFTKTTNVFRKSCTRLALLLYAKCKSLNFDRPSERMASHLRERGFDL